MRNLSENILNNIKSSELKEAIEPKYEKSNREYNKRLRDVKHYTGSYEYLFGGKVSTECHDYPVIVNYFYYERPYYPVSYHLVVNVLTPLGTFPDHIQEAIDKELASSETRLSNNEIKERILQIISDVDAEYRK